MNAVLRATNSHRGSMQIHQRPIKVKGTPTAHGFGTIIDGALPTTYRAAVLGLCHGMQPDVEHRCAGLGIRALPSVDNDVLDTKDEF